MVKKILTKFAVAKKPARSEGMSYRSPRIYLPTKLTDDSTFPFKEGDLLSVKVDGRKLVIQRAPKEVGPAETGLRHPQSSRPPSLGRKP